MQFQSSSQWHLNASHSFIDYQKEIDAAIYQTDPNINIGIKIRNLNTDEVIYERNSDRYYTCASAQKFITYSILHKYFGSDYKFISKIWQKNLDFYLDINDADFGTNDLDKMLQLLKLKMSGEIENFYIVNSTFSLPSIIDTKIIEDTKSCDGVSITKVHINKNCNSVGVVNDNLGYVKLILQELLIENNFKLMGNIFFAPLPNGAVEIVQNPKSFYEIASYAMKVSDNFITDYFLAEFASIFDVKRWSLAGHLLKQYAKKEYGINLDESEIVDGSGISRYNMFTPNQFDTFLNKIYLDQNFQIIQSMLARPGEIGTLRDRFQGVNIFAKTGTLTGVSSLVGYVYHKNNTPYSFVIISNNYLGGKHKYAQLEERIIRILLN